MKIIDFHTHLQDRWLGSTLMDDKAFIADMDECGVQVSCIFTLMGFYGHCPQENDRLAAFANASPQRLIPFATVDPKLGPKAIEELERCMENPVFRGIKFHPWMQAFAPSMFKETMIEILKIAAHHDVPVLFHDGTPPYSSTFQIAATARWVPEAKIILGHGGLGDYVYSAGQLLRDLPNLYACTCCPKASDIHYLVKMAGAEKVLFGSDYGISSNRLLSERIDDLLQSELPAETLQKVSYDNAARLLHLNETPLRYKDIAF